MTDQLSTTSTEPLPMIDPAVAAEINRTQLLRAQLMQLDREQASDRLVGERSAAARLDPSAYRAQSMERRLSLLAAFGPTVSAITTLGMPGMLDYHGRTTPLHELFDLWHRQPTPIMNDGLSETPGLPGTSGEIGSMGTYAGGCGFGGEVSDNGSHDPYQEKWWIRNWNSTTVFPAMPAGKSVLRYRFVVNSHVQLTDVSGHAGTIQSFVTVGTTPDANVPITNFATVGWPVNETFPLPYRVFDGSVPVSGEITGVAPGRQPAIGFIFGVIVGLASGWLLFGWGNFGTHIPDDLGGTIGAGHYGKIDYKFA